MKKRTSVLKVHVYKSKRFISRSESCFSKQHENKLSREKKWEQARVTVHTQLLLKYSCLKLRNQKVILKILIIIPICIEFPLAVLNTRSGRAFCRDKTNLFYYYYQGQNFGPFNCLAFKKAKVF